MVLALPRPPPPPPLLASPHLESHIPFLNLPGADSPASLNPHHSFFRTSPQFPQALQTEKVCDHLSSFLSSSELAEGISASRNVSWLLTGICACQMKTGGSRSNGTHTPRACDQRDSLEPSGAALLCEWWVPEPRCLFTCPLDQTAVGAPLPLWRVWSDLSLRTRTTQAALQQNKLVWRAGSPHGWQLCPEAPWAVGLL